MYHMNLVILIMWVQKHLVQENWGPMLLIGINFNLSMNNSLHPLWSVERIYFYLTKFNNCTIKVWNLVSNFITHFRYWSFHYLSMIRLKFDNVCKTSPSVYFVEYTVVYIFFFIIKTYIQNYNTICTMSMHQHFGRIISWDCAKQT